MPGMDLASISPELLNEMLQDHQTELAPLLAFEQFADVRNVGRMQGTVQKWLTPIGLPADGHRSSEVAPGSSTPLENIEADSISYNCKPYKKGIPLTEEAKMELETMTDISNRLVLKASMQVLKDFNKSIANTLLGNGTSGNDQALTEKAVSNAWDTASGTIIDDVDDVVLQLRGAGRLQCIMGLDIAQIASKNSQITGDAAGSGREYIDFARLVSELRSRGVADIYIDGTAMHSTEPGYARDYSGIFDGVFYIGTVGNIVVERFQALMQKIIMDDDKDLEIFKAKHCHGHNTTYAEHGFFFTGTKT